MSDKPKPKKISAKKKEFLALLTRIAHEAKVAEEIELRRREIAERQREKDEQERQTREALDAKLEAERLSDEKNRDIELQAWRKSLLEGRERAMLEIVKWRTYMQCNPLPDVTRQSELTTYLTLWRDEVVDAPLSEKSVLNVTEEVNKCHAAELVNNMVQSVIGSALETGDTSSHCWHSRYIQRMRMLAKSKVDSVTRALLDRVHTVQPTPPSNASSSSTLSSSSVTKDPATAQFERRAEASTPSLDYAFWAYVKATGSKMDYILFDFYWGKTKIILPWTLSTAMLGIRVIRTRYNFMFPEHPDDVTLDDVDDSKDKNHDNNRMNEDGKRDDPISSALKTVAEFGLRVPEGIRKPGELGADKWTPAEGLTIDEETDAPPLLGPTFSTSSNTPSYTTTVNLVVPSADTAIGKPGRGDNDSSQKKDGASGEGASGLRDEHRFSPSYYISIGSMFTIEQLLLPPPPKSVSRRAGPMLRDVYSDNVVVIPFKNESQGAYAAELYLPQDFVIRDQRPLLASWDSSLNTWRTDYITISAFDPVSRKIHLRIARLLPFSVIQPRALDFPYVNWSIGPAAPGIIRLRLQGSRFTVILDIRGHTASLISPRMPCLSALLDVPLEPGLLLLRLADHGINLLPRDSDVRRCCRSIKTKELESFAYAELASIVPMCEVSNLSWNGQLDSQSALIRYRLVPPEASALVPEGVPDPAQVLLSTDDSNLNENAEVNGTQTMGNSTTSPRKKGRGRSSQDDNSSYDDDDSYSDDEESVRDFLDLNGRSETKRDESGTSTILFDNAIVEEDLAMARRLQEELSLEQQMNEAVSLGVHTREAANELLMKQKQAMLDGWKTIKLAPNKATAIMASVSLPDMSIRPLRQSHISLRRSIAEDHACDIPEFVTLAHQRSQLEAAVVSLTAEYERTNQPDTAIARDNHIRQLESVKAEYDSALESNMKSVHDYFVLADQTTILSQESLRKLLALVRPLTMS